jgi:hypothetical protein
MAWLGETKCRPIGTPCPTGNFLDEAAIRGLAPGFGGKIWYVKPGAGGDGSLAQPFGSLGEALGAAANGAVVALSKGDHSAGVSVARGVAIVGACAGGTVLAPPSASEKAGTLEITGADHSLVTNLRVTGPRIGIWVWATKASVVLSDLAVEKAVRTGIAVTNKAVGTVLRRVVVRDTQSRPSDRRCGRGFEATTGGQATIELAAFERNRDVGVLASDDGTTVSLTDRQVRGTLSIESERTFGNGLLALEGARMRVARCVVQGNREAGVAAASSGTAMSLADVVVRDTLSQEKTEAEGRGLVAQEGAELTAERTLLERNREAGVLAASPGTKLSLADVVVRDTLASEKSRTAANGLEVQSGARAVVERALVERSAGSGVLASDQGASLSMTDVVIRDTSSQPIDGTAGWGLFAQDGADVNVERALVERNRHIAVYAGFLGTALSLQDVTVRDTLSQASNKRGGRGLEVGNDAHVTVRRTAFERNLDLGVLAYSPATTLSLTEVLVRDTRSRESDQTSGRGLEANGGARLTVEKAVLARNRDVALLVRDPGTTASITDLVARDTLSKASNGFHGSGLGVTDGAVADVARVLIERNRETGAVAFGAATKLSLRDAVLRGTRVRECADAIDGACIGKGVGSAAVAVEGAVLEMDRFEIEGSAMCGVQIARDARVVATNGFIHHNVIGLNVQIEAYDLSTVIGPTVRFFDNGTNLETKALVLPGMPGGTMPSDLPPHH